MKQLEKCEIEIFGQPSFTVGKYGQIKWLKSEGDEGDEKEVKKDEEVIKGDDVKKEKEEVIFISSK